MKIYRRTEKDGWIDYYFMTTKKNGLFCASLEIPDIDTLQINATWVGQEVEDKAWEESVEVPVEERDKFNIWINREGNYEHISEVLRNVLGVDQEEIDKVYDRDPEMVDFTQEIVDEGMKNIFLTDYEFKSLYRKVKYHMNIWNNDKERVKKYLIEHGDVGFHHDGKLIDIFGEMHPTKRKLYRDFSDWWGAWNDLLDDLIEEAVEKYPDENDFDKAYYYVKEEFENPERRKAKEQEKTAEE